MNKAIVGTKLGMSQVFTDEGLMIPVTVIQAGPCPIVQIKTQDKDGYQAIQVGYKDTKEKRVNKCLKGHYKKAKVAPKRFLKEFRVDNSQDYKLGQEIKCDMFAEGDIVDVTGTTRGRGFTGTIQRWNMHRGPMTHGSGYHRGVGAVSACAYPGRVFKNKKMPGQYGNEQVTIQNLRIVKVDGDRNLLLIKGAIPGPKRGLVVVRNAVKG